MTNLPKPMILPDFPGIFPLGWTSRPDCFKKKRAKGVCSAIHQDQHQLWWAGYGFCLKMDLNTSNKWPLNWRKCWIYQWIEGFSEDFQIKTIQFHVRPHKLLQITPFSKISHTNRGFLMSAGRLSVLHERYSKLLRQVLGDEWFEAKCSCEVGPTIEQFVWMIYTIYTTYLGVSINGGTQEWIIMEIPLKWMI